MKIDNREIIECRKCINGDTSEDHNVTVLCNYCGGSGYIDNPTYGEEIEDEAD